MSPLDHLIAFWLHFWPIAAFFLAAQMGETIWTAIERLRGRA